MSVDVQKAVLRRKKNTQGNHSLVSFALSLGSNKFILDYFDRRVVQNKVYEFNAVRRPLPAIQEVALSFESAIKMFFFYNFYNVDLFLFQR
jgi:hypothetical protein